MATEQQQRAQKERQARTTLLALDDAGSPNSASDDAPASFAGEVAGEVAGEGALTPMVDQLREEAVRLHQDVSRLQVRQAARPPDGASSARDPAGLLKAPTTVAAKAAATAAAVKPPAKPPAKPPLPPSARPRVSSLVAKGRLGASSARSDLRSGASSARSGTGASLSARLAGASSARSSAASGARSAGGDVAVRSRATASR